MTLFTLYALGATTEARAQNECPGVFESDPDYTLAAENDGVQLYMRRFWFGSTLDWKFYACARFENQTDHAVRVTAHLMGNCDNGSSSTDPQERTFILEPHQVYGGGGYQSSPECFAPCPACSQPNWLGWAVRIEPVSTGDGSNGTGTGTGTGNNGTGTGNNGTNSGLPGGSYGTLAVGTSFYVTGLSPHDGYFGDAPKIIGAGCEATGTLEELTPGWYAGEATCNGQAYSFYEVAVGGVVPPGGSVAGVSGSTPPVDGGATNVATAGAFNDQMAGIATDAALGGPMGGDEASGRTWHLHLSVGAGFPTVPLLTNTEVTCTSGAAGFCDGVTPSSAHETAFGVGVSLELGVEPVFAPHYGFGFYGWGQIGAAAWPGVNPGDSGTMMAGVGALDLRGFVGNDGGLAVIADAGEAWRIGSYFSNSSFSDSWSGTYQTGQESGHASYRADRLGVGLRYCLLEQASDDRFCKLGLAAEVLYEHVPQGSAPLVYRLELMGRTTVSVWAEMSFGYPAGGTADYPVDGQSGTLLFAHIGYSFDHFGKHKGKSTISYGADPTGEVASGEATASADTATDRDGDGIVDPQDHCPDDFGSVEDGCPQAASSVPTPTGGQAGATLSLDRSTFATGDTILVDFAAPGSFASDAWIGVVPSSTPHGNESDVDAADVAYRFLQGRTSGTFKFTAPGPGSWDVRMCDTDADGREVASQSFTVTP